MQDGKVIAISDVHLDTWGRHDPATFRAKHRAFMDFLEWVREASGAQHFVIAGDLLDVPRPDHGPVLPLFADLARALLQMVRAGLQVHYLSGNHDAGLVAIEVQMVTPSLHIGASVALSSGGRWFWLEHGHLMDAWLWDYVQRKAAQVRSVTPQEAMGHFTSAGPAAVPTTPATAYVYDTLYDALQWRALERGFTREEKLWGLRVMSQHLADEFADVAAPGELPAHHAEIHQALDQLGLTVLDLQIAEGLSDQAVELFQPVGLRYYSALPWRRAARHRLQELNPTREGAFAGIVLGHTHVPDLWTAAGPDGPQTYANCGGWGGQQGNYVSIDNGELVLHRRSWRDPLP